MFLSAEKLGVLALAGVLACFPGCRKEEPEKLSLKSSPSVSQAAESGHGSGTGVLKVAVAAIISPKETYSTYKDIMNYLGEKTGLKVEFVQRETYQEINDLLERNEVDLAFVCTGAYVDGHDKFGMELLVAPEAYGQPYYHSYIIVPKDSAVTSFLGLEKKRFAFTDPLSNTGKLSPTFILAKNKRTPDTFFASTTFTYSHDKSIESVANGLVDGAAVDSLVYDYLNKKNPKVTSKTKIVNKSDPYGIPPVVTARSIPPELRLKIREILLRMHEEERGRQLLSPIFIDRFVIVDDKLYDSVRTMQKWVAEAKGK